MRVLFAVVLAAFALAAPARAAETIRFVTDWKAQAEHGGFYQAKALGLYDARGLDVQIIQGGPAINIPQLLAAGAADMGMGSNSFIPLNLVAAGADIVAVAAVFQKDPQVLITHPREDVQSIADMKGKPIMVSDATIGAFWVWLAAKFDFTDDQIRKYTFNLAPFLTDPMAIQQGYLSSEPYLIETEGGFKPQVFLLADAGYPGYANMILVPTALTEQKPQAVRAFVEASLLGWRSYLHEDPAPGNALIKADNPEMTDDVLSQAIQTIRANGLVETPETQTFGIGFMSETRWKDFFEVMSANGVYEPSLEWRRAYSTEFLPPPPGVAPAP
ncbi:MAG: ABC transporter substrate-binding protein [Alphaproteobacteria bacterium]|nr:ABC transporter substrate-binding protein [Alphaproteobacteria bacterium]